MFRKSLIFVITLSIFLCLSTFSVQAEPTSNSGTKLLTKAEKTELVRKKIKRLMAKIRLEKQKVKLEEKKKKLDQERKRKLSKLMGKVFFPTNYDISSKMRYKRIQERALSCELSAASDILAYFENKRISEQYVIKLVKKSFYNKLPIIENGKTIWGNPNAGYVGNIDKLSDGKEAKQHNMTGYGVLEKPIKKIYDGFKYKSKIITKEHYNTARNNNFNQKQHLTELLKAINNGNMVQLWGDYCTTPKYEDTKNTNYCKNFYGNRKLEWYYKEDGNLIKHTGLAGEHAFYLLGYKGGVNNPTHITVWDTMTGKHTYPISEWIRKWNLMQNRSIIVYKKV